MNQSPINLPAHVKHIHCIGIGGSGMFPIVQILHSNGYKITGSDNNEGDIVNLVRGMGIEVMMGHREENIKGADLVMYTAAVLDNNPEIAETIKNRIPLWERAKVLGAISSQYENAIGICGTHGKTTVTSMLVQILHGAKKEPSAVIGGKLKAINGYGIVGNSQTFVYEACEFKDHFLETFPDVSVVLNIDNDHMEYFGTIENAMASYTQFCNMASHTIYNGDDEKTTTALNDISSKKPSFGFRDTNDFYATNITYGDGFTRYYDLMHKGECITRIELNVPGTHNILNSIAAATTAYLEGVSPADITTHLAQFGGAGRRFEVVGKKENGVIVVDDYAHHPAEIIATLKAAKELSFRHIYAVFQPFTFSRTQLLLEEFAQALSTADQVILTPIMGSREVNTSGITSKDLGDKIPHSICCESFEETAKQVVAMAQSGDLIITLGCGDVYKCARMML